MARSSDALRDDGPLRPIQRPVPLAQQAYEAIRASLLIDAGEPMRRLTEDELAQSLPMSRTPIREALHRLALAGIVVPAPGGGYVRPRTSLREIVEQSELRLALEPEAAALAARHRPEIAAELREHPLVTGAETGAIPELDFHVRLADASGNTVLAELIRAVNERVAVHRAVLGARHTGADPDRDPGSAGPLAIVAAVGDGDAEGAAEAMRAHLRDVQASMSRTLAQTEGAT